ncbi:MAG: YfdX family protein [Gammaproteobacteria bacterium]|nr:YfdX family protein [Gammaproteobacteria bacterium]MCP5137805.1 YfdX family protein [Gammaproteobacteria bacterium]
MNTKTTVKPLVAAILVALAVSGVARAESVIKEEVNVTAPQRVSAQDEATISASAVKALRHIAAARGELNGDNPDAEKAKAELAQADKLLDIIRAALPTAQIKDRIWVAKKHLEYEDTQAVLPDLIPIYASLDELVDYVPTSQAKQHLDDAKQAMKDGDKAQARENLDATDDALLYVEADLPLHATQTLVDQARADLSKGDTKAADTVLTAAEDNVVLVSFRFDSPLTLAKAALWRANQEYLAGESDYAKADLNDAVKQLEQAAKSGDDITRKAATDLVPEVRELHDAIADTGTGTADEGIKSRLASNWHRVKALSERSVESLSTGWQRLRAEGVAKKDLIEAKLQLAYARIDHFYSQDDAAAKVELAEARGYLDAALKKADGEARKEVENASKMFDRIDKDLKGDAKVVAARFGEAESQLSAIIHQL